MGLRLHVYRRRLILWTCLFIFLSLFLFSPPTTVWSKDPNSRYDPVEVEGKYLPEFIGLKSANLRLLVFREGELKPTIFQIDERTPQGQYVLPLGERNNSKDSHIRFTASDILFFMWADAGARAPAAMRTQPPPGADRIQEIALESESPAQERYAYFAHYPNQPPPLKNEARVALLDDERAFAARGTSWQVEGVVNRLGKTVYKTVINKKFSVFPEAGGNGRNFLDRMKIRAESSLLFDAIKISVNENKLIGRMDAYRTGPARNMGLQWLQLVMPLRLKSPVMYLNVYTYDYFILIPVRIVMHFNPGYVLTYGKVSYGYDFNEDARGMKFYNSNNLRGFVMDGKMSEAEKAMDNNLDRWRLVTGPQGTMAVFTILDERLKSQLDRGRVTYLDDFKTANTPEDIPGSMGSFFYNMEVTSIAAGEYHMLLGWFFPPNFYDPNHLKVEEIESFLKMIEEPLTIKIGKREFNNPGGWPALLQK